MKSSKFYLLLIGFMILFAIITITATGWDVTLKRFRHAEIRVNQLEEDLEEITERENRSNAVIDHLVSESNLLRLELYELEKATETVEDN